MRTLLHLLLNSLLYFLLHLLLHLSLLPSSSSIDKELNAIDILSSKKRQYLYAILLRQRLKATKSQRTHDRSWRDLALSRRNH